MSWRRLPILPLVACAVALSACSTSENLKPKGRAVVAVQTGDDYEPPRVELLNEVVVQLPPIKTPGNRWTLVANDERYLRQISPVKAGPDGVPQTTFLAIHGGRRTVRFFALVPGQREAVPTQTYEIVIQIAAPPT